MRVRVWRGSAMTSSTCSHCCCCSPSWSLLPGLHCWRPHTSSTGTWCIIQNHYWLLFMMGWVCIKKYVGCVVGHMIFFSSFCMFFWGSQDRQLNYSCFSLGLGLVGLVSSKYCLLVVCAWLLVAIHLNYRLLLKSVQANRDWKVSPEMSNAALHRWCLVIVFFLCWPSSETVGSAIWWTALLKTAIGQRCLPSCTCMRQSSPRSVWLTVILWRSMLEVISVV